MSSDACLLLPVFVVGTGGSRSGTNQCLTVSAPYEVISDTYFQVWRESNDGYFSAGSEMHSKMKLSV